MDMKTGKVLEDLLIKPISGDHFHTIAHAVLENHRYACSSNRGAKNSMTVESVTTALAGVSCSNHALHAKRCKISE